ncbi:MAG: hypothetical protein V1735_03495 [Nanoarchaeota archaeon]
MGYQWVCYGNFGQYEPRGNYDIFRRWWDPQPPSERPRDEGFHEFCRVIFAAPFVSLALGLALGHDHPQMGQEGRLPPNPAPIVHQLTAEEMKLLTSESAQGIDGLLMK